jgi:2-polyprenyl-6-methoxyphenol hydroxylase-like FAD-dependent oxidoreductase
VPVPAGLVVGADGLRSTVARAVDASVLHRGSSAGALVYGYWPMPSPLRPEGSRYRWFYRSRTSAGVIPTNDGSACIWAGLPADAFAERRHLGLAELMGEVLASAAPEIAELVAGHPTPRLFGFPGVPAMLRTPVGPGWALVGDAGWFKDPLTAHGISDALRDAEFLAQAALGGSPAAFRRYQQRRDELSLPLLRAAEPVVGYGWTDDEIPDLLRTESAAMKPEVAALRALDLETRAA